MKYILNDDNECLPVNMDNLKNLNDSLNNLRDEIDKIDTKIWKKMRWFVNDYDFKKNSLVINRAYYKYLEIIIEFGLYKDFYPENILHLAEAPGGFIQVSLNIDKYRLNKCKRMKLIDNDGFEKNVRVDNVNIYTMTLANSVNHFSFDESILKHNVKIVEGHNGMGDLLDIENVSILKELSTYDIVTSDGGFDDNNNYNKKEEQHHLLIETEVKYGIECCKNGGHFVIKIFDMFEEDTFKLIGELYSYFEHVIVYKPYTSRPTNSEKYVVCKYKRNSPIQYNSKKLFNMLHHINQEIVKKQCDVLTKSLQYCTDEFYEYVCANDRDINKHKRELYNKWKSKFTYEAISYNSKTGTYS